MGVSSRVIEDNSDVFRAMLGLVRGRVYYNLLNWYRVVAMLPGYASNRTFFEQMLGVKQGLQAEEAGAVAAETRGGRLPGALAVARTAAGVVLQYFLLPLRVSRFRKRLDDALGRGRPDYTLLRPDELAARYRELERKLLPNWDAPIVNDFFCMIFHGVLRSLAVRWCGEALDNALLVSGGRLASIEPFRLVSAMGRSAAPYPELVALLTAGDVGEIVLALEKVPEFNRQYREYLEKYGDRCLEELKLESAALNENPLPLLRSVGRAALAGARAQNANGCMRARAKQAAARALRWHPVRRAVFAWVLASARARIRGREQMRLERTRVFGRVRQIVVELGRRLYAADALAEPRDVFYLEIEEVLGFVAGAVTCTNLRGLAALRKAEYAGFARMPVPAGRFETRGIVNAGHRYQPEARAEAATGSRRTGTGCCPGTVRGRVRVIADPHREATCPGEILVAERTDPGWIVVFPFAAGIIVEHGSILSHTAIVAREMGIPAVVSLSGATSWLRTGDHVQLDGASGEVVKVPNVEQCA
jgi:pyruvate,water dikinase